MGRKTRLRERERAVEEDEGNGNETRMMEKGKENKSRILI